MLLKPFQEESEEASEVSEAIEGVLVAAGVKNKKSPDVKSMFHNHGAGLEDVAKTVSAMLKTGEEATRLKACDIALKVAGVFKEIDENKIPEIVININGNGNQTLLNLVLPNS